MKILLAHNSLYYPSHGGGDKSNRLLMESLAALGHTVQVMARLENFSDADQEKFIAELAARDTPVQSIRDGVVIFERNGVAVFTVASVPFLRAVFAKHIETFDPDIIICSTDDPGALLLEVALRSTRARIVYLVRATVAVPFGPDCAFPNASKTEMLGRVDSIVGVSEYVAQYVRQWSGFPAIHVPISLLDPGDYSDIGRFDNEFVLMVNPCAVKGISIFTGLAEAMPDVAFAAVPTWGTNPDDLAQLRRHANIHIFEPVDDIAVLLRRTRVVLVPSVWAEARSRMVVEAMIRGIPVMASDVGGLHEAKLGVEYLLPVNPIARYTTGVDSNMVPVAEVPAQDIEPWREALDRLITNRAHYDDISRQGRAAALAYAEKLHGGWLEAHLEELIAKPKRAASAATVLPVSALEKLSPAKRQLLALRMHKSKAATAGDFFPKALEFRSAGATLFCFPWAGGGTTFYRNWNADLLPLAEVFPALLPGREARAAELPFTEMSPLIDALTAAIRPHLTRPFVFYGHSMGAGIAFELARSLRRNRLPLPQALIVASARAPQLRTAPTGPDPTDAELTAQLRQLGGLPDHEDLMRLILPALRADTHLYRHYCYEPEPPLDIPIHAFYGERDPSLTSAQVEAWKDQSTELSSFQTLPGGHFFPQAQAEQFLRVLIDMIFPLLI